MLSDERRAQQRDLAEAREEIAKPRALRHDVATPLGVALALIHVLLRDATALSADDRKPLEDIARALDEGARILKRDDGPPQQVEAAPLPDDRPGEALVLVADDDSAMGKAVSQTLASQRYQVLEAADAQRQRIAKRAPAHAPTCT